MLYNSYKINYLNFFCKKTSKKIFKKKKKYFYIWRVERHSCGLKKRPQPGIMNSYSEVVQFS
jgi:hypothetical protein